MGLYFWLCPGCKKLFYPDPDRIARHAEEIRIRMVEKRVEELVMFDTVLVVLEKNDNAPLALLREEALRRDRMVEFKEGKLGEPREMKARVVGAEIEPSKLASKSGGGPKNQLHIVLHPEDKPWKDQHEWYGLSDKTYSAFAALVNKCVDIGLISSAQVKKAATLDALAETIGKRLKAEDPRKWAEVEMGTKSTKPLWCPQ